MYSAKVHRPIKAGQRGIEKQFSDCFSLGLGFT